MRYYPVNLDILDRPCLVIGGGAVGARKVATLLDCGARITIVSPRVDERLHQLAAAGAVRLHRRAYQAADLSGMFLVIGATDDERLNTRIKADADRLGVLCNIADRPKECHFILPSVINRGDLIIAVSTSGKSPAFAKHLRRELEVQFGPEYEIFLRLMGAIRDRLLSREHAPEAHKPVFERLIAGGLLEMVKAGQTEKINALLLQVLGSGYDTAALIGLTP